MRDTAETVLALLPSDVQYGDIRVVRRTHEQVLVELDGPGEVNYDDSLGLGLRVVIGGYWGFAATHRLDPDGIDAVVAQAVGQARAAGGGDRGATRPADRSVDPDWSRRTGWLEVRWRSCSVASVAGRGRVHR